MKRYWQLFVVLAVALINAACAQVEIDITCGIYGVVKDHATHEVIENCQVSLSPTGQTVATNADGSYSFQSLDAGRYTLTFTRVGYQSQTKAVQLPAGERIQCDVQLKQKGEIDPEDPEDPENPENPDNPDNPENPENPDNPDNPENPENPDNPENPQEESVFAGGTGAAYDPYLISTKEQMQKIKDYASSHFKLAADIDMTGISWNPVQLSGGFDGDNHTLYNVTINPYAMSDNQGLFSELANGASVKNLTINGFSVNAAKNKYIGAIAGKTSAASVITNCHVILKTASAIVGDRHVGGIAGMAYDVSDCTVSSPISAVVIAGDSYVGGAVGFFYNSSSSGKVQNVSVSCHVFGETDRIGGVIGGHSSYGYISQCSFEGTISTGNNAQNIGGIIGYALCSINSCKAKVQINISNGNRIVGGIAGYRDSGLNGCYSTGFINGLAPTVHNFIGSITGHVSSSSKCHYCYSTMDIPFEEGDWSKDRDDSYSVAKLIEKAGTNINLAEIMRAADAGSAYFDYDRTWKWTGTLREQSVTAICPKLKWEK